MVPMTEEERQDILSNSPDLEEQLYNAQRSRNVFEDEDNNELESVAITAIEIPVAKTASDTLAHFDSRNGESIKVFIDRKKVIGKGTFGFINEGKTGESNEGPALAIKTQGNLNREELNKAIEEAFIYQKMGIGKSSCVYIMREETAIPELDLIVPESYMHILSMQKLEGSNLSSVIEKSTQSREKLNDKSRENFLSCCLQGMEQLEKLHTELGVAHCDIKPGNIIVNFDTDSPTLTIIDFGAFAHLKDSNGQSIESDIDRGTIEYYPPELARLVPQHNEEGVRGVFDEKADVYGFVKSVKEWYDSAFEPNPEFTEFFEKGMHPDPNQRFTVREAKAWLKENLKIDIPGTPSQATLHAVTGLDNAFKKNGLNPDLVADRLLLQLNTLVSKHALGLVHGDIGDVSITDSISSFEQSFRSKKNEDFEYDLSEFLAYSKDALDRYDLLDTDTENTLENINTANSEEFKKGLASVLSKMPKFNIADKPETKFEM